MSEILAMVYVGGAIGCWLALWNHDDPHVQKLKLEHQWLAAALATGFAALWPTVLAAVLVWGALDE